MFCICVFMLSFVVDLVAGFDACWFGGVGLVVFIYY